MTSEAPLPYQQCPEAISPKIQAQFRQLQNRIIAELKPTGGVVDRVVIYTSNSGDPFEGNYLSLSENGVWDVGYGRVYGNSLNQPSEPVKLLKVLQAHALIKDSQLDEILRSERQDANYDLGKISKYANAVIELQKSVKRNPHPFAESLFGDMEKKLQELYKKKNAT